jgi:hypothetical protein
VFNNEHSVIMPVLGLTMTTGHVAPWLVEEGTEVAKGQFLWGKPTWLTSALTGSTL